MRATSFDHTNPKHASTERQWMSSKSVISIDIKNIKIIENITVFSGGHCSF